MKTPLLAISTARAATRPDAARLVAKSVRANGNQELLALSCPCARVNAERLMAKRTTSKKPRARYTLGVPNSVAVDTNENIVQGSSVAAWQPSGSTCLIHIGAVTGCTITQPNKR